MFLLAPFIEGFILGLGASIPLGPINILIMNEALRSYKKAVAIGFGAMSADITYLILIFYGITNYLQEALFLNILSLVGGCFLFFLSFLIFKGRNKQIEQEKVLQESGIFLKYIKGYILTLINPLTILFWLSVTTYSTTTESISMTFFGMIMAITLWIILMPYAIYTKRSLISHRAASIIAIVSSLIILLFALSLFFKGFTLLLSYFLSTNI